MTVYLIFGDILAKYTLYTPYINGSGNPIYPIIWVWSKITGVCKRRYCVSNTGHQQIVHFCTFALRTRAMEVVHGNTRAIVCILSIHRHRN